MQHVFYCNVLTLYSDHASTEGHDIHENLMG